jgi:predicted tellurium resistance membrane protein TerC
VRRNIVLSAEIRRVFDIAVTALMLVASGPLASFIERRASVKMLALSFFLLIGMVLLADDAGFRRRTSQQDEAARQG